VSPTPRAPTAVTGPAVRAVLDTRVDPVPVPVDLDTLVVPGFQTFLE
jgi:hypothetical protein